MRNSWSIIYLTKDYEASRSYFLETAGDWSPGQNVAALVVSLNLPWPSKLTKKMIILQLDQMESCRSFDSFELNTSLKIILVYFFLDIRSISSCCFCGLVVLLFCSLMPKVKFLSFGLKSLNGYLLQPMFFEGTSHFVVLIFLVKL